MAQNIIIDIQVQDGKAQAKIRGLEGAFKDLKDVIKDAREQLREKNKVLTGSSKYYEKQINDLKKFRDETAKTGLEYRKQTAEINKLVAAQQAITGPVAGSVAALQKQRNALIQQQKQLATTAKQYDDYAKKIASVQSKIDALAGATTKNAKVNEDLISSSGLAGATLTELGRTISDAPYGIRGMTNNLQQLSTLFITLGSKTKSFTRALALLGKQLMGPLGVILAFQTALAAIDYFFGSTKKAEEAVDDLTDSLENQNFVLRNYIGLLKDSGVSDENKSKILAVLSKRFSELNTILKDSNLTEEERIRIATDFLKLEEEKRNIENEIKPLEESRLKRQTRLNEIVGLLLKKEKELSGVVIKNNATTQEGIALEESRKILRQTLINDIESLKTEQEDLNNKEERYNELLLQQGDIFLQLSKFIKEKAKEETKTIPGTIAFYQEQIKLLQEIQTNIVTTTEGYQSIQKEIDVYIQKIKDLKGEFAEDQAEFLLSPEFIDTEALDEITKQRIDSFNSQLLLEDRLLAEKILRLKQESITREEFEEKKRQAIAESVREEIALIDALIPFLQLEGDLREKYLRDRARLMESLISLEKEDDKILETKFQKLARYAAEINDVVQGIAGAFANLTDAEISREERKTEILNNQLKERLRNEKLSADERARINRQIELNEEKLQRKRDEIAERNFKLQKAAAIAQATVNTALAVSDVLAQEKKGLIGKTTAAIIIGALGAAQVAAIARTKFVPSASATPSGQAGAIGTGGGKQDPIFNIVGTGQQFQLSQAIAQRTGEPVKAYVVTGDVRSGLALERNIINGSKLG